MLVEVANYNSWSTSPNINAFVDALLDKKLKYVASTLRSSGLQQEEELKQAVEQAMKICAEQGIPVREHFKPVYVSDEVKHTLTQDWHLSQLAYALVMLNGNRENPFVGKLQLTLIRKFCES